MSATPAIDRRASNKGKIGMTETAKLEALKPCPFCLNELSMARDYDGDPIYTHPDSENCVLSGTSWDADCFDVKAWNTRAHSVSRPAVKVRKLEWVKSEIIGWNGDYHTVPTGYSIRCADENGWKWSVAGGFGYCSSPEAAKAAAQSDFEQRILSSLSPPTGGWKGLESAPLKRTIVVGRHDWDNVTTVNWANELSKADDLANWSSPPTHWLDGVTLP